MVHDAMRDRLKNFDVQPGSRQLLGTPNWSLAVGKDASAQPSNKQILPNARDVAASVYLHEHRCINTLPQKELHRSF